MANEVTSSSDQDFLERSIINFIRITNLNKGKLFLSLLIGGILGVALSFSVTKKYTSKAELLPEFSSNKLGSLSSLASLAGFDAASSGESDAVRPDLYPNIILSTPGLRYLLNQPVTTITNRQFPTLLSYFENLNGQKLPKGQLSQNTSDTSLIHFNIEEVALLNQLKSSISANFDKKSGVVLIGVEMTDAKVAGLTLTNSITYLKEYVTKYRLGKKGEKAEFVKTRVRDAKKRMQQSQRSLQQYKDQNRNLFLNTAKIQMQNLEMELNQAETVYNDLARQYEQAQIEEIEKEPVIHLLEPPQVPSSKSSPRRILFGIGGSVLASLLMLIFLIIRPGKAS
jgi:uncharacterized protein involved in exopolysaccharide biosynthesis